MSWFFPKSPSPEYLDSCQGALDEYPEVMRFVLKKIIDEYKGDIERFKEDNGLKLLGPEQFKALLTGKLPAIITTELELDSLPSNRWNPEIEAMRELVGEKLREILSSLSVREALVLAAHAGYNCSPMTFKEISIYLNVSHLFVTGH